MARISHNKITTCTQSLKRTSQSLGPYVRTIHIVRLHSTLYRPHCVCRVIKQQSSLCKGPVPLGPRPASLLLLCIVCILQLALALTRYDRAGRAESASWFSPRPPIFPYYCIVSTWSRRKRGVPKNPPAAIPFLALRSWYSVLRTLHTIVVMCIFQQHAGAVGTGVITKYCTVRYAVPYPVYITLYRVQGSPSWPLSPQPSPAACCPASAPFKAVAFLEKETRSQIVQQSIVLLRSTEFLGDFRSIPANSAWRPMLFEGCTDYSSTIVESHMWMSPAKRLTRDKD